MAFFTFVLVATSLLVASSAAPQNTKLGITIPEECRGKGFCSIRPEGYDQIEAQIDSLFPKHLILNEVGTRSGGSRIGDPSDDDDNCPSETTPESVYSYVYPNGTDPDIIVQTNKFPQQFAKVTCKYSNEDNEIDEEGGLQCFTKLRLMNMKSSCKQFYGTRTLVVFDPTTRLFKMKNYPVPVCCSCVTRKL